MFFKRAGEAWFYRDDNAGSGIFDNTGRLLAEWPAHINPSSDNLRIAFDLIAGQARGSEIISGAAIAAVFKGREA